MLVNLVIVVDDPSQKIKIAKHEKLSKNFKICATKSLEIIPFIGEGLNSYILIKTVIQLGLGAATMTHLLQTGGDWSLPNGMQFAPTKCISLATTATTNSVYFMYNIEIPAANSVLYLGVWFDRKGVDWPHQIEKSKTKAIAALNLFKTNGYNITGFNQSSSILLFKSFLRPALEYGVQLGPPKLIIKKYQSAAIMALGAMFSATRNTSINALLKITNIAPMSFRIESLMVRFWSKLYSSTDKSIPAVVYCWKSSAPIKSKSLAAALKKLELWRNATKLNHARFCLRTVGLSHGDVSKAYTDTQWLKLSSNSIATLDNVGTNVAASISYDENNWKPWKLLVADSFANRSDRIGVLRWLIGNVCYHEICRNCSGNNELSRVHALSCIGAHHLLESLILLTGTPAGYLTDINTLSRVINWTKYTATNEIFGKIAEIVSLVFKKCKGYEQNDNGFWSLPDTTNTTETTNLIQEIININDDTTNTAISTTDTTTTTATLMTETVAPVAQSFTITLPLIETIMATRINLQRPKKLNNLEILKRKSLHVKSIFSNKNSKKLKIISTTKSSRVVSSDDNFDVDKIIKKIKQAKDPESDVGESSNCC